MFRLIIIGSVVITQVLMYVTFVLFLRRQKFYKPWVKWAALVPFLLIFLPFLYINIFIGRGFQPPPWLAAVMPVFYIWMGASLMLTIWLLAGKALTLLFMIPVWIAKILKPSREKINRFFSKPEVKKVSHSRREFVKYATGAVTVYAFASATYGYFSQDDYEITHREIHIDNLPAALKGVTITLISDLHSGLNMSEADLRMYTEAMNELNSDIICVPGDLINSRTTEVPPVINAFRDLNTKYGAFGSLGNHDFFQDPDYVASAITNESPVKIIRNNYEKLHINGHDLFIIGVDDTRSSGSTIDKVVIDRIDEVMKRAGSAEPTFLSSPKILLCHKPYGFDTIAQKKIDLTLAGHTHGGQVVPFKMGRLNVSLAGFASKYVEGLYTINKMNMYVSRGVGSIIVPLRLNCPPEITKITLV
jgi:predicted MPP superfamily phosphohydrolase